MSEPDISALAKRLAEQNNVDWRKLSGTGEGGKVVERDVLDYLARVMAGEEAVDPTPEPLPEGMESWPDQDAPRYFDRGAAASAPRPDPAGSTPPVEPPAFEPPAFEPSASAPTDATAPDTVPASGLGGADEGGGPAWGAAAPAGDDPFAADHDDDSDDSDDVLSDDIFLFDDGTDELEPEEEALPPILAPEPASEPFAATEPAADADLDDVDDALLVADDDDLGAEPEAPGFQLGSAAPHLPLDADDDDLFERPLTGTFDLGADAGPAEPDAATAWAGEGLHIGGMANDDELEVGELPDLFAGDTDGEGSGPAAEASEPEDAITDAGGSGAWFETADGYGADVAPLGAGGVGFGAVEEADGYGTDDATDREAADGHGTGYMTDRETTGERSNDFGADHGTDYSAGYSSDYRADDVTDLETAASLDELEALEDVEALEADGDALPEAGTFQQEADADPAEAGTLDAGPLGADAADAYQPEGATAESGAEPEPISDLDDLDELVEPAALASASARAADLPLTRAGTVLRRHVDLSALASAQLAAGLELGRDEPLAPAPFLLRAVAKAAAERGWVTGQAALADLDDGLLLRRVDGAAERPFAELVEELSRPGTEEDELGIVAVDLTGFDLDEALLDLDVPAVTLGRILYDTQRGAHRSTLTLTGDVPLDRGAALMARVAELLESPVRLLV